MKSGFSRILKLGTAPLAIAAACLPVAAAAEEAAVAPTAPAGPAAQADEPIIVTGTRIRLPNLTSHEPTVTIDGAHFEDRGLTNVADALNESPGVRTSTTPAGLQSPFGQAMNFVNLYGLGVNRTLVLVNGKRQVSSMVPSISSSSPGTPVDLNTIPTNLVERIDRVGIGGAPVYGTDAIAGTINVILKRRLTGLDLSGMTGITGEGDNRRTNLAAAWGKDFAGGRGNASFAVSWDKMDGVLWSQRWFYRASVIPTSNPCSTFGAGQVCTSSTALGYINNLGTPGRNPAIDGRVNPTIGFNNTATDGVPGTILVAGLSRPVLTAGGVIASASAIANAYNWQFDSSGNIVAFNRGTLFGAAPNNNPGNLPPTTQANLLANGQAFQANSSARASGGDGFRVNNYSQIVSGLERLNTALFLTYELSDAARLTFDGTWSRSRGDQLITQPSFNATNVTGRSGSLSFRTDNPFLTAQARQQLTSLGYTTGTFTLSRANDDLTDPSGSTDSDLYRAVLGLDGKFAVGSRSFNYEVYADYGRSDVTDYYQDLDQQKFINAINVATVNGQIVCTTTPTVTVNSITGATLITPVADPNCKPLNLFGRGVASPEALAYIRRDTASRTRLEQFVVNANIGGSPFDLNGNPASFNLGLEHHTESASFTPDAFIQQGFGRLAAVQPIAGKYDLNEAFGEVLLPLISPDNAWPVSKLEAFARVRRVDSSLKNSDFTAWSAGGAFAPVRDIEFRGNFTRSFRAPAITELYATRTAGTLSVPELCAAATITSGSAPATRKANCDAFIARYGQPALASVSAAGYAGGNPNLRNERADSFTYGVIVRPRFVPGLSVSVDYLNIRIKDPIAFQTIASIASGCFDNPQFNAADPANGNPFCSLIQRTSAGAIVNDPSNPGVTTGYVNGKRIRLDAVQATLDWRGSLAPLGLPGGLALGGDAFFLRNRLNDITGVAPAQSEGLAGDPKFQAQMRLGWGTGVFGFTTQVNVTGAQAVSYTQRGDSPNDFQEIDHYDPYATVDGSIWVKAPQDLRLTLAVTNLFNRIGQAYYGYYIPGASGTAGSINDPLGRRFTFSARKQF